MTDTTMQGEQIGSVISLTGSVWAVSGNSQRPLTEGAPVYEGEEIVTESDSNVEIKFSDDTVLGQGEDSAVRLDDYVYTEDDNQLDFHMVKGVMRVVSGEIVKANPEGFNLSTPLATIGIRGTQVMVQVDNGREIIGVDELGEGHTVLVGNAFNQIVIDQAGMFSGVDFDGSLIAPDEMPTSFISTIVRAAPLTILGDTPRSPGESQEIIPPEIYDTIDNQTGDILPGAGAEEGSEDEDEEDDLGAEYEEDSEEEFELTEAEIEALLELETAAGTEAGGPTEEFGQVVDVNYDLFGNQTNSNEGDPTPPPAQDPGPPDDPTGGDEDDTVEDTPAPPAEEVVVEQAATGENEPVTFNVLNDAPEGSTLVEVELAVGEDHHEGEFEFEPEGTITYTPAEGEDGTVIIDYTVEDSLGGESSAQVSVTLADDSEPVIETTDATGTEAAGVVTASGTITTDFGADVEGSSVELAADGAHWDSYYNILVSADGSWDIELTDDGYLFTQNGALTQAATTDAGEALAVDVTVTATDSDGDEATGVFSVALTDDGPVANDVILTEAIEDMAISYNVFDNEDADTGLYGGTLTKATLAEGSKIDGKVSFDSDGNITFTPAADESGTASIEYTVTDSDGDTATAQMTIDVQPVNDAPEAEDKSFTSTEDTVFTITSAMLLEGSSDVENDSLSVVSVDGTDLPGTLADNEDSTWTFTPSTDWNGELSLAYTVTDGDIETNANIDLTVTDDMTDLVSSSTVESVETSTTTDSEVTGVDTTVTVDSVRDAETGDRTTTTTTTTDTETTTTDTTTTETTPVTTNVFEDGSEQVIFGDTTTGTETDTTVSHTITSEDAVVVDLNDAPTAEAKSFTSTEDTAFTITSAMLLEGTSDADNDTVSVVSVDGTNLPGTLVANDNDSWTFTPSADWNGELSLSYTVTDGFVETDANIALTVSNDMTDLVNSSTVDSIETTTTTDSEVSGVDTTVTVDSVRDAETGDRTTTTTTTTDTETTTTETTTTETTPVTTNVYEDGSEQVVFGETTTATETDTTVSHTISSEDAVVVDPNDAPTAQGKSFTFAEDTALTLTAATLLEGTSDADNDTVSVVSVDGTNLPGTLVANDNDSWTFTPSADWNGNLNLSYTVTDGFVETDANIALTVSNDMTDLVSSSTVDSIETTTTTDSEVTGVDTTVTVDSVRDAETGDRTTTTTTTIDTETTTTDTTTTETTPVTTNVYEDGSEQVVFGETTVTSDVDTTVAHALISEDLIVVDPNDAPEVEDKSFNFDEDTSITITSAMLLEGSSDAENDVVNVVSVNGYDLPGELVDNEDSTWTFTPETDWNGELNLSYTVTDGYVESDANISLTINPVDENDGATRGQDVILGTEGDDSIDGMQGKDVIYGTNGNDEISGSQGKDAIFGGEGNDTISGGQGHDELIGGAGDDELTGGQGNDTFVFTSPEDGIDHIVDFNTARDQIELYVETFSLAMDNKGHVVDDQFISTTAAEFAVDGYDFENATSGLVYLSDTGSHTGALFYDPDDSTVGNEVLITNVTEDNTDPDADLTAVDIDIA